MANLIVSGGKKISGTIKPSGNKNAVLPMLCATLLTNKEVVITNVPEISDVEKLTAYFHAIGSDALWNKEDETLVVTHAEGKTNLNNADLPIGIRSAVLLLAPTMRRAKKLTFDTSSKGCTLGLREIDPHLNILQAFGCDLVEKRPYKLELNNDGDAADMWADYASVTATETFVMMAVTAQGTSTLTNAASEPHVQELCHFLNTMGAKIEGVGTSTLTVHGVSELSGTTYRVPDDHHEVATFLAIGGVTGGELRVETNITQHMTLIVRQLEKVGLQIKVESDALTVTGWTRTIKEPLTSEMLQKIEAAPWPYFPADLLPQLIGVSVGCTGNIMFWNKIYEGALAWSSELSNFGAKVQLSDPHRLVVFGGNPLRPATVQAPYIIRVVMALFITAIQIKGESTIKSADPLKRAHPHFVEKMIAMGADVRWEE